MVGKRNTKTFKKLWELIKQDNCIYYTDDYEIYSKIIPQEQHVIGKEHTFLIESNNSNTRHRLARMTRKTKVVSKSTAMIDLTIGLWHHLEYDENFGNLQNKFLSIFG